MKIEKVAKIVGVILVDKPETRDDDFILYYEVLKWFLDDIEEISVRNFLKIANNNLPPFETVTRARRKIQERHPELRGKKYEHRIKKQIDFIDFSRSDE